MGSDMAFIRKKMNRTGRTSYQVVRSIRHGGQVKQQVLITLAHEPTIAGAIRQAQGRLQGEETAFDRDPGQIKMIRDLIGKLRTVQRRTGLR